MEVGFSKANQAIAKKNLEKPISVSSEEIFSPSVPRKQVLDNNVKKSFYSYHELPGDFQDFFMFCSKELTILTLTSIE